MDYTSGIHCQLSRNLSWCHQAMIRARDSVGAPMAQPTIARICFSALLHGDFSGLREAAPERRPATFLKRLYNFAVGCRVA